jgi:signal transduction histidine kinase
VQADGKQIKVKADLGADLADIKRQLQESEARFRDIIERNADAIIVVDQAGIIRFANREAGKLFNRSPESLNGSAFGFPVVVGETTELDLPHDGTVRVVEMRVVESQWQGDGARIASLRDVTERKRAEEDQRELIREQAARSAAEQEARRFRFLAESSSVLTSTLHDQAIVAQLAHLCAVEIAEYAIVFCTDREHVVHRVAMARRHGQEPIVETTEDAPLTPQDGHAVAEVMRTRASIVRHDLAARDIANLIPDPHVQERLGAPAELSVAVLPMIARGKALGALTLIATGSETLTEADVALAENLAARAGLAIENARLYTQAREANQTKTELLAVISHDLRTPLNSIIGYAQLLEIGIPDPLTDGSRERVHRILQSSGHLLYLIDELLAFARVEGEHEDIKTAPCDVVEVLKQVRELIEPIAHEKGLTLRASVPGPDISIVTDADKLRQVLVNLVGNAVKYTAEGSVEVTVEPADSEVTFRVSDTGVGISKEHLPRIFEPFWQADRSQRSLGGGTGLGLSVVQRVVALLGGRISVQSELGKGTTFSVTLPRLGNPSPADAD